MTECARVILCDPNAHASRAGDRAAVDIPGADIPDDQTGYTHRAIAEGVAGWAGLDNTARAGRAGLAGPVSRAGLAGLAGLDNAARAGRAGLGSAGRAGVENHGPFITMSTDRRLNGRAGAAAGRNGVKCFEVAA
ncbi:hypothetical protein GCM10010199_29840 [Dactylosporangium roseum]